MNCTEKNIQLLSASNEHYFEPLDQMQEVYELSDRFIVKDATCFLVDNNKECCYIQQSISDRNALYFYFGMSSIQTLLYLCNHITEGSKIIVVEKNKEVFANALGSQLLADVIQSRKVQFIVASSDKALHIIYKELISPLIFLAANTVLYFEDYYYYFEKKWVKSFSKKLLEMMKSLLYSVGNDIGDTLIGIKNSVANMDNILASHSPRTVFLSNLYRNQPAIIVAAGPSLNKQLSLLKEMKGKALILCVDTALAVLLKHGIIPDAVVTSERISRTYEWFYENLPYQDQLMFMGLPMTDSRIFDKFKHRIICYRQNETVCEWLHTLNRYPGKFEIGMSCAHLAFGFAKFLGCSPIVLIGQDLAYGEDNSGHAAGTSYEDHTEFVKKRDENQSYATTKGYYGGEVYTEDIWNHFRVWYEQEILGTESVVYNCTEGGAYIEGAIHIPFVEACKEIDSCSVPSLVIICEQADSFPNRIEIKEQLRTDLEEKKKDMIYIGQRSKEGIEILKDVLAQDNRKQSYTEEELEKIVVILQDCDEIYRDIKTKQWFGLFFQGHVSRLFYEMSLVRPEFCEESILENVRVQHRFFTYVLEASHTVISGYKECEAIL